MSIININNLLEIMKNTKTLYCYEYYDGLHVSINYPEYLSCFEKYKNNPSYADEITRRWDNKYLIPDDGSNLNNYKEQIFSFLPNTTIEVFIFTSRFPTEIRFECLKAIPKTLNVLYLEHYIGVDIDIIKELYCLTLNNNSDEDEEYCTYNNYNLINNRWSKKRKNSSICN